MRAALFLDRDGTLIVDVGYPRDPAQVVLLPDAAATLAALPADLALVIVTNQSGLARGLITASEAVAVQAEVERQLAVHGVGFAGVYVCPHSPEAGMLLDAARDLELDLARSLMLGDKAADVEAGRAAGCGAALRFGPGAGSDGVSDWAAARPRIAAHFGLK